MKEFRIYFAIICIAYLTTLTATTFASDDDHSVSRSDRHIESNDDVRLETQSESKKQYIKRYKEQLRLIALIAKLRQKNHTTNTPKVVAAPIKSTPSKPIVPVTSPKPVTTVISPAPVVTAVTKTSTVTYRTPAGSDPVTFTATVKGGVITAASSVTKAQNGTSIWYQDAFTAAVSQSVVGKKTAGLNLSAIGGASLTTAAFEQFIANSF